MEGEGFKFQGEGFRIRDSRFGFRGLGLWVQRVGLLA